MADMRNINGNTTQLKICKKIAKLFGTPVTELLDDYNLFLYSLQEQQVKKIRKFLQLTQSHFTKRLSVLAMVKRREQGKVRIFKGEIDKTLILVLYITDKIVK